MQAEPLATAAGILAVRGKFNDPVALRVTNRISEDRGALVRSVRAAQLEKQVVAVEEVVPEHKGGRSPR